MTARKPRVESPAQKLKRLEQEAARLHLEATFSQGVRAIRLPPPRVQYRFHPARDYRADFAWPQAMLMVEIDGGTRGRVNPKTGEWEFKPGAHTTGDGYHRDRVRDAEAALAGWLVLRLDANMVTSGDGLSYVERILKQRKAA